MESIREKESQKLYKKNVRIKQMQGKLIIVYNWLKTVI